jgi:uncharacterized protein (DUF983 family)
VNLARKLEKWWRKMTKNDDFIPKSTKLIQNIRCPHCDSLFFKRNKHNELRCKSCGNYSMVDLDEVSFSIKQKSSIIMIGWFILKIILIILLTINIVSESK